MGAITWRCAVLWTILQLSVFLVHPSPAHIHCSGRIAILGHCVFSFLGNEWPRGMRNTPYICISITTRRVSFNVHVWIGLWHSAPGQEWIKRSTRGRFWWRWYGGRQTDREGWREWWRWCGCYFIRIRISLVRIDCYRFLGFIPRFFYFLVFQKRPSLLYLVTNTIHHRSTSPTLTHIHLYSSHGNGFCKGGVWKMLVF